MQTIDNARSESLKKRITSALVGLPLILMAVWSGSPWIIIVVIVISLFATRELAKLISSTGIAQSRNLNICLSGSLVISAGFWGLKLSLIWLLVETVFILICVLANPVLKRIVYGYNLSSKSWLYSLFSTIYIGVPLTSAILLRLEYDGQELIIFALLCTFATDTCSFAVGRMWGRTKMAPKISPGKTWEGAIGGLFGGGAIAAVLVAILDIETSIGFAIPVGLLIAIFAQIGDLGESKLKRIVGVKDSGILIPGHGGMLDRLDSFVLVLPFVYCISLVLW